MTVLLTVSALTVALRNRFLLGQMSFGLTGVAGWPLPGHATLENTVSHPPISNEFHHVIEQQNRSACVRKNRRTSVYPHTPGLF